MNYFLHENGTQKLSRTKTKQIFFPASVFQDILHLESYQTVSNWNISPGSQLGRDWRAPVLKALPQTLLKVQDGCLEVGLS